MVRSVSRKAIESDVDHVTRILLRDALRLAEALQAYQAHPHDPIAGGWLNRAHKVVRDFHYGVIGLNLPAQNGQK